MGGFGSTFGEGGSLNLAPAYARHGPGDLALGVGLAVLAVFAGLDGVVAVG